MGKLVQQLANSLFVGSFAVHQRRQVQRDLLGERAGQFFQLRIALLLTVLAKPRSALHKGDEECETDQNYHRAMQPEFKFCAYHIPPLKICSLMLPEALVTR